MNEGRNLDVGPGTYSFFVLSKFENWKKQCKKLVPVFCDQSPVRPLIRSESAS